jgi:hypothetical protein
MFGYAVFRGYDGDSGTGDGGGWYGGGASGSGANSAGSGGSGGVFTDAAYSAWQPSGTAGDGANKTDYLPVKAPYLNGDGTYKLSMTNDILIAGNALMPNPADINFNIYKPLSAAKTMTGNANGGVVRVVYLGD